MSASSPRGPRGGSAFRGAPRGAASTARSTSGSTRGTLTTAAQGRGRGRGRGGSTSTGAAAGGEGLLQKLRTGTVHRGSDQPTANGRGRERTTTTTSSIVRGRGHLTKTFNSPVRSASAPGSRSSSPALSSSVRDFMDNMATRFQSLKQKRELERAKAIKDGFLADPEKKTTLDQAITPVGTCTEMCPEFERVERMVQNMVDKSEKVKNEDNGRDMPFEAIMVKRFRRSAAGYDEQLPSDIRTPDTLKRTMDYLADKVVGGSERLAVVHKFVWDRTRAVRNDFSIQQVSKKEDVKMAVDCYERIARFHILSMHQLCNPDNLLEGENFDFFQEREQLNNTLLSLMYYYDDNRDVIPFPNEAEFRAYCIIFEIQSQQPDLEDRMQAWPGQLLLDKRVETALKLYRASSNTLFEHGPLRPMAPYALAQNYSGGFWTILSSSTVPYLMACVAEIYFAYVRFAALDAVWKTGKSAPQAHQAKSQDWALSALTDHLGFDEENQTFEFCGAFDLTFSGTEGVGMFLDFSAHPSSSLDKSKISNAQKFSHTFVEDKRCRRNFVAIINGMTVPQALRAGMVEEDNLEADHGFEVEEVQDDGQSLFIPETSSVFAPPPESTSSFGSRLNPEAADFTVTTNSAEDFMPSSTTKFGESANFSISTKFGGTSVPAFSTKFGEAAGFSGPPSMFGRQEVGKAAETSSTSSSAATLFPTPSLPAAPAQPSESPSTSQERSLGITSHPTFSLKSPFTTPAPITTASSEQPTPSFTAFSNTQPRQLLASDSPSSLSGFHFPKLAQPVRGPGSSNTPSTTTSFNFTPSITALPSQTTQASFPSFSGPADPEESPPLLSFTSQPSKPSAKGTTEPATQQNLPVFETIGQKPFFQPSPDSTGQKPLFNFPQAALSQPPPNSTKGSSPSPKSSPRPSSTPATFPEPAKPQIPSFNFPSTQTQPAGQAKSQLQIQQATSNTELAPLLPSLGQVATIPTSTLRQSTPQPALLPHQPSIDSLTASDRAQLVDHLARLSLCQPNGLLQEYLEFSLPKMLKGLVSQHDEELRQTALARLKTRYLRRKYGFLWRKIAYHRILHRKAVVRRKKFAEFFAKEARKSKKMEQERLEIVKAMEEKKRLQAEMKSAQEEKAKKEADVKAAKEMLRSGQLAGTKRKSLDENSAKENANAMSAGTSYRNHKRSRTIGSTMPPPSPGQPSPRASSTGFRFSGTSLYTSLCRSRSFRGLRKLNKNPSTDTTKTDFFRLLAHGVDPETPWIPLTATQVAAKEKKEKEERAAKIEAAYNRRRIGTPRKKPEAPAQASPASESPPAALPSSSPTPSTPVSTYNPEFDELLQQLIAARKQMAEDTEWLRQENERMAKEIEQEEKPRASSSSNQSERLSFNGLPMVNGYEYYPAPPGQSLSRVEQRILATGARGLAYKPIGGDKSSYVPVAMPKKSARRYTQATDEVGEIMTIGSVKKRRKHGDIDRTYRPSAGDELDEEEEELEQLPHKRSKGAKHSPPAPRSSPLTAKPAVKAVVRNKPLERLQRDPDGEDDDEEELEYDDEEGQLYYHNGDDGDTEELEDEEDELLEDSEDEGEDEDEEGYGGPQSGRLGAASRLYEDAPTPNTQTSHVSSGAGATADDPLELSD